MKVVHVLDRLLQGGSQFSVTRLKAPIDPILGDYDGWRLFPEFRHEFHRINNEREVVPRLNLAWYEVSTGHEVALEENLVAIRAPKQQRREEEIVRGMVLDFRHESDAHRAALAQ